MGNETVQAIAELQGKADDYFMWLIILTVWLAVTWIWLGLHSDHKN